MTIDLLEANVMCPNKAVIINNFVLKLRLQRYAPSSIKTYKNALLKFLEAFKEHDLKHLSLVQIQQYIHFLQLEHQISASYQKQILATIVKFYGFFFNRSLDLSSLYPKRKTKSVPKYLTAFEVKNLLLHCSNEKHLCILKILYGCGLRVSEVVSLKQSDLDFSNMQILIRSSRAQKSRKVPLPISLIGDLQIYLDVFRPKEYLFEGQKGGAYSIKSIQNCIKKYALQAKIFKIVSPHTLRHSYAVHQLEKGVNIHYIKELLGHSSIKTTERYTQIIKVSKSNIMSPLDQLDYIV